MLLSKSSDRTSFKWSTRTLIPTVLKSSHRASCIRFVVYISFHSVLMSVLCNHCASRSHLIDQWTRCVYLRVSTRKHKRRHLSVTEGQTGSRCGWRGCVFSAIYITHNLRPLVITPQTAFIFVLPWTLRMYSAQEFLLMLHTYDSFLSRKSSR